MAFRKRNVAVDRVADEILPPEYSDIRLISGVRPSSVTSHSVTSSGTPSLDSLLGGHGGLALGCSLLIEESGTTDFAGALLRYYAAEGTCHGHVLHLVGVGDPWVRGLPGVVGEKTGQTVIADGSKMKIAWRYERALPDRTISSQTSSPLPETPFCHTFDLTKRLSIPKDARINYIQISAASDPFESISKHLQQTLAGTSSEIIHRLVIPTILSPAIYPPHACRPENIVRFLRSLRVILRQHSTKLTAMITLPLELHPRKSGLVRWAEILSDGVMELTPFPHLMDASKFGDTESARSNDEKPQGMLKVHKLPLNTERGEGGAGAGNSMGEDLAFTVSRRKFVIKPFSLPPLDGDRDRQVEGGGLARKDVEF